jgi:hypothetical protein
MPMHGTISTGRTSPSGARRKMKPDVIVSLTDHTALFKTQNQKVSEWLHRHCHLATENLKGQDDIYVHPTRCRQIIEDLKGAGFNISTLFETI